MEALWHGASAQWKLVILFVRSLLLVNVPFRALAHYLQTKRKILS